MREQAFINAVGTTTAKTDNLENSNEGLALEQIKNNSLDSGSNDSSIAVKRYQYCCKYSCCGYRGILKTKFWEWIQGKCLGKLHDSRRSMVCFNSTAVSEKTTQSPPTVWPHVRQKARNLVMDWSCLNATKAANATADTTRKSTVPKPALSTKPGDWPISTNPWV